jgi:NAD(P)-dependent dehydrogenase (short-subunit alcohol dehydrogenase family)
MTEKPPLTEEQVTALTGPRPAVPPSDRLAGKVCLVMGATRGIGAATAIRMAEEGARAVVLTGRNQTAGDDVAGQIRALGVDAVFVPADVTVEADVQRAVSTVMDRCGRLDAVFNNAGYQEPRALVADQSDATYDTVFNTNVRAIAHCLRFQIPAMLASGGGTLVNNTSVSAFRNPYPGLALYNASKAAAITLTRSAALEYAPQGIRINAVAPGRIVTEMLNSVLTDLAAVANTLPLNRMGRPEELAAIVCWLLSPDSAYVCGHVLCADGGFLVS